MAAWVAGGVRRARSGPVRPLLAALLLALAAALAKPPPAAAAETFPFPSAAPGLPEGERMELPKPLSAADASRYAAIFELQEAGRWAEADAEIARLEDPILLGHVLAQRYLHPIAYRSKFAELAAWLEAYSDHPDAARIYKLALKRQPAGAASPRRPVNYVFAPEAEPNDVPSKREELAVPTKKRSDVQNETKKRLEAEMRRRIARGWPSGAREILDGGDYAPLVSAAEYDVYRTKIARGYFSYDRDEVALALATASAARSGEVLPEAQWVAGLAAWRLGDAETARGHFEAVGRSPNADNELLAASSYWAARANLVTQRPERVNRYLLLAAEQPFTFYGLLAARALGLDPALSWLEPTFTAAEIERLLKVPGIVRSLALVQAGQPKRAEAEIEKLAPNATFTAMRSLLAVAARIGLPSTELSIALKLHRQTGETLTYALYPVPPWSPADGYAVDRALLYSIIRLESKFSAGARNPSGARGLMQLMPATASSMARHLGLKGFDRSQLDDPTVNMALGQAYLKELMDDEEVGQNLFYVLAAYNSGPGKVLEWLRALDFRDDPLLFVEAIPSPETREFVEEIFTSYWIYRARLRQASPSLDVVAAGGWPLYIPQENGASVMTHAGD